MLALDVLTNADFLVRMRFLGGDDRGFGERGDDDGDALD